MGQEFFPVRELHRAAVSALRRGQHADTYVSACPRVAKRGKAEAVARGWCLWVDLDTPAAVQRLHEFSPRASIINESGSDGRLHAYWPLSHAVPPAAIERSNERLALALLADLMVVGVHSVIRAAGTGNFKHAPPGVVRCIRLEPIAFRLPEVVAGLQDMPLQIRPSRPSRGSSIGASSAAVDGVARVVRSAVPGERNSRLNWAAYALGPRVAEGTLARGEVECALFDAATDVGLGEGEALATIRSGLEAGIKR